MKQWGIPEQLRVNEAVWEQGLDGFSNKPILNDLLADLDVDPNDKAIYKKVKV